MIKVVGITGLMASGKSFVSDLFSMNGAMLFNTDQAAHAVSMKNEELRNKLITKFGEQYYNGIHINKPFVRALIFDDTDEARENLQWVNETVGPYVIDKLKDFKLALENGGVDNYILVESAILFETGLDAICDDIIVVRAPNACIAAVKRDNITRDEWRRRMSYQLPESEKTFDYVVNNDYTPGVEEQVRIIHEDILNKYEID